MNSAHRGGWLVLLGMLMAGGSVPYARGQTRETLSSDRPIPVVNPQRLTTRELPAVRIPLGIPNDYKPWVARLSNGDLLLVAFCFGGEPSNKLPPGTPYLERAVFWRSTDGGQTWGPREERPELHGREFSLNVLSDGTLLMPCHFLANDAANPSGYTHSKIFRSTDAGKTWTEQRIGPEGFPDKAETMVDWTPVEYPDPERPGRSLVYLGVSMQNGRELAPRHVTGWRSRDSGATWDKTLNPDTGGWSDVDGFFSQSVTFRLVSGAWLHTTRVDATGPHWKLPDSGKVQNTSGDQDDRTMLWRSTDFGRTWKRHGDGGRFGTYGEMYPRFVGLLDGRLLLTFTVRSRPTDGHPIGLRAILSRDQGETWDFDHDRLVLSDRNHGVSGGGFGNTIQLPDGTLLSCYSYRGPDDKTHVEAIRWRLPSP
ncbi:MAG: exo-alpha-sialidase [Planctomycetes bacterium]|nr:exo-alpha-sialidase [Planctomycetota bacterium]